MHIYRHFLLKITRFYEKASETMKHEAIYKLSKSNKSVFKDDVRFKYIDDEETAKRVFDLK